MQENHKTELILFDLDGTLIDTAPDFHTSLNTMLKKYNMNEVSEFCLLYTSPSPRDVEESRMPSSA